MQIFRMRSVRAINDAAHFGDFIEERLAQKLAGGGLEAVADPGEVHFETGEGLAEFVVDFARDELAFFFADGLEMGGKRAEPGAGIAQLLFGLAMFAARPGIAEFALDGRSQAGEAALDQIIMRAGLHGGNRLVFADGTGDDEEGEIDAALGFQGQRRHGAEAGDGVIRDDEVPVRRFERLEKG